MLKWIAKELHMGDWTHVANRLQKAKVRVNAGHQDQFNLVQKHQTDLLMYEILTGNNSKG